MHKVYFLFHFESLEATPADKPGHIKRTFFSQLQTCQQHSLWQLFFILAAEPGQLNTTAMHMHGFQ